MPFIQITPTTIINTSAIAGIDYTTKNEVGHPTKTSGKHRVPDRSRTEVTSQSVLVIHLSGGHRMNFFKYEAERIKAHIVNAIQVVPLSSSDDNSENAIS